MGLLHELSGTARHRGKLQTPLLFLVSTLEGKFRHLPAHLHSQEGKCTEVPLILPQGKELRGGVHSTDDACYMAGAHWLERFA